MNRKPTTTRRVAAFALGISVLAVLPATAVIDPNFNTGDLILGVQSTASTSIVLEINLGAPSLYKNGTSFLIGNINSDLTGLFGATWYDAATLLFGVSGANNGLGGGLGGGPGTADANGDFNSTAYISRARGSNGTFGLSDSLAWNIAPASVSTGALQLVAQGNTFTSTSTNGIAQVATSNPNDWSDLNPVSGGIQGTAYSVYTGGIQYGFGAGAFDTGAFGGLTNVEGVVDLYRITRFNNTVGGNAPTPGLGAYLGSIAIERDGDVHFVTVPEPSSAAVVSLGLVSLLGWRARRPTTRS